MLINVSIRTLSQGTEAIKYIYINSNIPGFQPLIQFFGSLSSNIVVDEFLNAMTSRCGFL